MSKDERKGPAANTRAGANLRLEEYIIYQSLYGHASGSEIPGPTFQIERTPIGKIKRSRSSEFLCSPNKVCIIEERCILESATPKSKSEESLQTVEAKEINFDFGNSADTTPVKRELIGRNSGVRKIYRRKIKLETTTMAANELSYTDIISAVPIFEGHQKDLDYFISTCSTYNEMVSDEQKPTFISIVKAKLKGIALTKMQPFADLNTWELIKTRLEEKFRRPMTYETAQDELSNIRQNRTESIESYGNNIRSALLKLNKACETLTADANALRLLRAANEKLAIRKFEQGLYNGNLKICVGARDFTTLDTAITYVMQKENLYKNESRIRCNYCGISGHMENECRRKQQNQSAIRSGDDRYRRASFPNRDGPGNASNTFQNARDSNRWENRNNGGANNNFRGGNGPNRWGNNDGNGSRNNYNANRNSNSNGNPNNSYAPPNSPVNKNMPQNARTFTSRTVTLGEAMREETKN